MHPTLAKLYAREQTAREEHLHSAVGERERQERNARTFPRCHYCGRPTHPKRLAPRNLLSACLECRENGGAA